MITPGRPRRVKRRVTGMQLTAAHLRYLLAIYEVSQTHLDISSRSIAEKLGVTKPSVVRIMNLLMERGMIVKEHYGKIYMTDRGIFVAKEVRAQLERVLQNFPPVNIELTEEERFAAALALSVVVMLAAFLGFGSAKLRSRYNEVCKWYTVGVAADNGYNLSEELTTRMNTAANIITTAGNTLGADSAVSYTHLTLPTICSV